MNGALALSQQFMVLGVVLAGGLLTGLLFDMTRAVKKAFLLPGSVIFLADLLLCLLAAVVVYQFLFIFNQGEVRFYVFISFFLGIIIYYFFCSSYLYKYMVNNLKCTLRLWRRVRQFTRRVKEACCRFFAELRKTGE